METMFWDYFKLKKKTVHNMIELVLPSSPQKFPLIYKPYTENNASIWLEVKLDAEQIIEKHCKNIQKNQFIWVNGPAYGKCVSVLYYFL